MWSVEITNVGDGVVNATAVHDSGFSWNSIVKVGDLSFAETAKEMFAKQAEERKDDAPFKEELLKILNK